MPVLHQMQMSGNCYKVRLTAHQLGVPLTLREYPLHGGETRKPDFLAKNPMGAYHCWNIRMAAFWLNPAPFFFT